MNIYELNSEFKNLINRLENAEPEEQNAILEHLSEIGIEREEKIENSCLYIKNLDAMADSIKAEEKNLSERRKTIENRSESMRNWLSDNLNGERFESSKVAVSWRKSETVEVLVPYNELPSNCIRTKTTHEPDKSIIKDQLKKGVEIAGCYLITKQNMQVK
jgi:seryl-tRNA synthetase